MAASIGFSDASIDGQGLRVRIVTSKPVPGAEFLAQGPSSVQMRLMFRQRDVCSASLVAIHVLALFPRSVWVCLFVRLPPFCGSRGNRKDNHHFEGPLRKTRTLPAMILNRGAVFASLHDFKSPAIPRFLDTHWATVESGHRKITADGRIYRHGVCASGRGSSWHLRSIRLMTRHAPRKGQKQPKLSKRMVFVHALHLCSLDIIMSGRCVSFLLDCSVNGSLTADMCTHPRTHTHMRRDTHTHKITHAGDWSQTESLWTISGPTRSTGQCQP